jgi:hypothetical protein
MSQAGGLISNQDVDSLETVIEIPVMGRTRLNIEFTVAVAALTAFEVAYRPHDGAGSYFVVASATADYTTPAVNSAVRGASGDLTGAGAAQHWLVLDCRGVAMVRLRAAGTSSTITGSWGAA